jgi:hypothetical protein
MAFGKVTVTDGYWWWREHPHADWKIIKVHADHIRRFGAPPIKLPGEGEFGFRVYQPVDMVPSRAAPLTRNRQRLV